MTRHKGGASASARIASTINSRARDIITGRALFSANSAGDDAAGEITRIGRHQQHQADIQAAQNREQIALLRQMTARNHRP